MHPFELSVFIFISISSLKLPVCHKCARTRENSKKRSSQSESENDTHTNAASDNIKFEIELKTLKRKKFRYGSKPTVSAFNNTNL